MIYLLSFIVMLIIESIFLTNIVTKSPKSERIFKKDDLLVGIFLGVISYVPFIIAYITSIRVKFKLNDYAIFSNISVGIVIIIVILMRIYYHRKINKVKSDSMKNILKDTYKKINNMVKSLFLVNSIIIGLVLFIFGFILKLPPVGFFDIDSNKLGFQILSGVLPVLGFAAIDFFDIEQSITDFLKTLLKCIKEYYGFYAYSLFFTIGFIFFLDSDIFSKIFLYGTVGAAIPFIITISYLIYFNKNKRG